jgi:hypothetical protein
LPANASQAAGVQLVETLGANLDEIVMSFPTTAQAAEAYQNFAATTNSCSWESTQDQVTTKFSAALDTNVQTLDSASTVWQLQGALQGTLAGGPPVHEGGIMVVRAGNVDAFAFVAVDTGNQPDLPTIENNIAPAVASQLASNN